MFDWRFRAETGEVVRIELNPTAPEDDQLRLLFVNGEKNGTIRLPEGKSELLVGLEEALFYFGNEVAIVEVVPTGGHFRHEVQEPVAQEYEALVGQYFAHRERWEDWLREHQAYLQKLEEALDGFRVKCETCECRLLPREVCACCQLRSVLVSRPTLVISSSVHEPEPEAPCPSKDAN